MATARARHGSYLSSGPVGEFYVKLRSPTGRVESLTHVRPPGGGGTGGSAGNRTQGCGCLPPGPRVVPTWMRELRAGLHTDLNGERHIRHGATELHYLDEQGHTIRTETNGVKVVG